MSLIKLMANESQLDNPYYTYGMITGMLKLLRGLMFFGLCVLVYR